MCDIFGMTDARNLLKNKYILLLGDSNTRALYKDIIWLLNNNKLIDIKLLKNKLEKSHQGDRLVGGSSLHKGRDFHEDRSYERNGFHIEFRFITRCYTDFIKFICLKIIRKEKPVPDVIVMNSCLWDISRWGPNGVTEFKDNLVKLMKLFKKCLPSKTLLIWITTPPVSTNCKGGFLIKQVEFLKHTLRFEVMEANMFARDIVVNHGFDILDIHHHLRMQIHRRDNDGIHWLPMPVRHMTNLLLTHIALSWDHPLPGNFQGKNLERIKNLEKKKATEIVFPTEPPFITKSETSTTEAPPAITTKTKPKIKSTCKFAVPEVPSEMNKKLKDIIKSSADQDMTIVKSNKNNPK